jgi:hypothetical protein
MPALSKKYKINYKRRYTIQKNKKQRGHKSIKVYHTRVKASTRKRKHYMGGDIEVPVDYNIFPSGQSYQPNMTCLEKECDKKDAGERTTTCLNTRIVMNLFSQTLDDSEKETLVRIDGKFKPEERKHVQDMTQKYLTNYVDSLFPKSFFSKNNADLTPENATKLKELLQVINPEYVGYLTQTSTLSDEIKQKIRASKPALNVVVDNVPANANNIDVVEAEPEEQKLPEPEAEPEEQKPPEPEEQKLPEPEAEPEEQKPPEPEEQKLPEPEEQKLPEPEAEPEAQKLPEPEAEPEEQKLPEPEAEPEAQRQEAAKEAEAEAEAQRQEVAKKAARKAEKKKINDAKEREMAQRFAQRRAERDAAEVKRKEDLAEKKAARAATNLINEENREAVTKEKRKQRDAATKTLKNTTTSKKSNDNGTRKKR